MLWCEYPSQATFAELLNIWRALAGRYRQIWRDPLVFIGIANGDWRWLHSENRSAVKRMEDGTSAR
jgi:hypothetical protein